MRPNKAVFLNTLRWMADAPLRLAITGLLMLMLYAFVGGGLSLNGAPVAGVSGLVMGGNSLIVFLMWVLGLGLISREINSGSIQLVLLRPLTRASFVFSKWLALAAVGLAALVVVHLSFLLHNGLETVGLPELALLFVAQVLQLAALAAVIALLSTVPINFGELGLLILVALLIAAFKLLNVRYGSTLLDNILSLAWQILLPRVDQAALLKSLLFNAAVCAGALSGAIYLLQKREFTYAEQSA